MRSLLAETTYVLPIRCTEEAAGEELAAYLQALVRFVPVIVVDGSERRIFEQHAARWPREVLHVPVDSDRANDLNGKAGGVVTGLRRVTTRNAIVADDDVRYDLFALRRVVALLDDFDVVRPQNVFEPTPWHAIVDEGRSLIARATGGDWPGTLGIRMGCYRRAREYDGGVLFENLELVRTLRARGARECVAYDVFVTRRPPTAARFWSQRVRQAYDECARPGRMAVQLAIAPLALLAFARCGPAGPAALALGAVALAEAGRRRGGAQRVFPARAALCAPVWVAERALTSWWALALRASGRGVAYSHGRLRIAAHSERQLRGLSTAS